MGRFGILAYMEATTTIMIDCYRCEEEFPKKEAEWWETYTGSLEDPPEWEPLCPECFDFVASEYD